MDARARLLPSLDGVAEGLLWPLLWLSSSWWNLPSCLVSAGLAIGGRSEALQRLFSVSQSRRLLASAPLSKIFPRFLCPLPDAPWAFPRDISTAALHSRLRNLKHLSSFIHSLYL